jgi:hypothetical protein
MSIEESQVIDIISTAKDGSSVTLTATDHLEWGGKEHLMMIQEKLNSYLAFVEGGEVFESYPDAKGKEIKIDIVCKFHPDEEGVKFLGLCQEAIENAGFLFCYKVNEI